MDIFIKQIKPLKVYLDSLDELIATTNIAFYYWYENADRQPLDTFMPAQAMEQAYYRTLCDFPLLSGKLVTDADGRTFVSVEKDDLNMPAYTDTACNVEFDMVRKSGFNTKLLPTTFDHARDVPAPPGLIGGRIRLAEAHVIRLGNNSGVCVFVSIAHCLVDASGFALFMKRWAELARLTVAQNKNGSEDLCERRYIHDRSFFSQFWDSGTDRLDFLARESMDKGGIVSRWLAWLSPEARGRMLKFLLTLERRINCYFHIPKEKIDALRAATQDHSSGGIRYSTNDILTAAIASLLVQSMRAVEFDNHKRLLPSALRYIFGEGDEKKEALVTFTASLRPRVGRQDVFDYTGNMAIMRPVGMPLELVEADPTPKTLAEIATGVREMVNTTDAQYIGQLAHLTNKTSDGYVRVMMGLASHKYMLAVSNHISFVHYDIDFGNGIPMCVRPAFLAFPNAAFIMPCHPDLGGYEIAMTLTPRVADKAVQNEYWMGLVDKHDYDV
ncbi:hypothetical protein LPJ81_005246 [Coemansia sp. IMI 209127]|nr:hypothetical protein LPJ81_005246 [Coemansia sp. IMI 209127]